MRLGIGGNDPPSAPARHGVRLSYQLAVGNLAEAGPGWFTR